MTTSRVRERATQIQKRRAELGTDKLIAALMESARESDMALGAMVDALDKRLTALERYVAKATGAKVVEATDAGILLPPK